MSTGQTDETVTSKRTKRWRVTERDKMMLQDLFRIRVAIEMDLMGYFGSRQNLVKRLSVLEEKGYVKREWYKPKVYGNIERTGKFVSITELGVQDVMDEIGYEGFDVSNVEWRPEAKTLAKFLVAAPVYIEQVNELEQKGWVWETGYIMRQLYENDLRYPAIGYIEHDETKTVVPIFMIYNKRTGRGLKKRVEETIRLFAKLSYQGSNLGEYTVKESVVLVPDELIGIALDHMKTFATSPFKLIPISDAKTYLAYAIGDQTPPNGFQESEPTDKFERLINTEMGLMYYVNLLKYNPVEFWKVVGYSRQKAEDDARYKERPLRQLCVVVSDMQAELIRKLASDTDMLVLVDQKFKKIKVKQGD